MYYYHTLKEAMLKLTSSFCRFIVTCERVVYESHVRTVAHSSCRNYKCGAEGVWQDCKKFHGKYASPKKQLSVKIPFDSMYKPTQPTSDHASHGGTFNVSTAGDSFRNRHRGDSDGPSGSKPSPNWSPPNFRVWEPVGRQLSTFNDAFTFKVVSYNVLAQCLLECHPYLYTDCAPRNLKWSVRAARLYDEIVKLDPDILCLQEVQVSHMSTFYSKFEELGYTGVYKQKTGNRQDGCAIYFKQALFEMQDHFCVELYQPCLPLLNRNNIGVMVKLVPKESGSTPIVIATTHLLFNPKRTDVRLAQLQLFLAEIDRFAYHCNAERRGHLPIILTGDLNSMPENVVIKLLDKGNAWADELRGEVNWQRIGVMDNCQHLVVYLNRQRGRTTDFKEVPIYNSEHKTEEKKKISSESAHFKEYFNGAQIGHDLRLISVYDKYKADGHYEATTYQNKWLTVDYMYYSCNCDLQLCTRLRMPTAAECKALERLPNDVYPSDHLALAATFQLQPNPAFLNKTMCPEVKHPRLFF